MSQVSASARQSPKSHEVAEPSYRSADERRADGKALPEVVTREAQGQWTPAKNRRDPVDLLNDSNIGRLPELVPIRYGRMMSSPFVFYRGSACIMAADLATMPVSGITVQARGDAHLSNFGGFATPERRVIFDINDFDETLPGPWEWDLKRLVASVVLAGRHIRLLKATLAAPLRRPPAPTASTWRTMATCGRSMSGTIPSTSSASCGKWRTMRLANGSRSA